MMPYLEVLRLEANISIQPSLQVGNKQWKILYIFVDELNRIFF